MRKNRVRFRLSRQSNRNPETFDISTDRNKVKAQTKFVFSMITIAFDVIHFQKTKNLNFINFNNFSFFLFLYHIFFSFYFVLFRPNSLFIYYIDKDHWYHHSFYHSDLIESRLSWLGWSSTYHAVSYTDERLFKVRVRHGWRSNSIQMEYILRFY